MSKKPGNHNNATWLAKQYYDLRKSSDEIAILCGVNPSTINRAMERFGLARRTLHEAHCGKPHTIEHRRRIGQAEIGENNPNWRGGKILNGGYPQTLVGSLNGGGTKGYKFDHRIIADLALGHPLPASAVMHHVNGIKTDNRNSNLVICENQSYHRLLHRRARERKAVDNALAKVRAESPRRDGETKCKA